MGCLHFNKYNDKGRAGELQGVFEQGLPELTGEVEIYGVQQNEEELNGLQVPGPGGAVLAGPNFFRYSGETKFEIPEAAGGVGGGEPLGPPNPQAVRKVI